MFEIEDMTDFVPRAGEILIHEYTNNKFYVFDSFEEVNEYMTEGYGKYKFILPTDLAEYNDYGRSFEDNLYQTTQAVKDLIKYIPKEYKRLYSVEPVPGIYDESEDPYEDLYWSGTFTEFLSPYERGFGGEPFDPDFYDRRVEVTVNKTSNELGNDRVKAKKLQNIIAENKLLLELISNERGIYPNMMIDGFVMKNKLIRQVRHRLEDLRRAFTDEELIEMIIHENATRSSHIKELLIPTKEVITKATTPKNGLLVDWLPQLHRLVSELREYYKSLRALVLYTALVAHELYSDLGIDIDLKIEEIVDYIEETLGDTEETREFINYIIATQNYIFNNINNLNVNIDFEQEIFVD